MNNNVKQMDTAPTCRLLRSSDKKVTGERVFRYESRSFLNCEGITPVKLVRIRGAMLISLSMSTCSRSVNTTKIYEFCLLHKVQTRLKKPSFCRLCQATMTRGVHTKLIGSADPKPHLDQRLITQKVYVYYTVCVCVCVCLP